MSDDDRLLTPGEVALQFRVDPKTVTRWAAAGRLPSIKTPGGHRRFRVADVEALLRAEATPPARVPAPGPPPDDVYARNNQGGRS